MRGYGSLRDFTKLCCQMVLSLILNFGKKLTIWRTNSTHKVKHKSIFLTVILSTRWLTLKHFWNAPFLGRRRHGIYWNFVVEMEKVLLSSCRHYSAGRWRLPLLLWMILFPLKRQRPRREYKSWWRAVACAAARCRSKLILEKCKISNFNKVITSWSCGTGLWYTSRTAKFLIS